MEEIHDPWRSVEDIRGGDPWRRSMEEIHDPWRISVEDIRGGYPWRISVDEIRGGDP